MEKKNYIVRGFDITKIGTPALIEKWLNEEGGEDYYVFEVLKYEKRVIMMMQKRRPRKRRLVTRRPAKKVVKKTATKKKKK
ncbi:MAG: hypothetical protein KAJ01_07090 [Candidatus Hydrogenedentes bacterium]|nr:hypothetical protein [Candidatus Hydrogenedentota bacterium]